MRTFFKFELSSKHQMSILLRRPRRALLQLFGILQFLMLLLTVHHLSGRRAASIDIALPLLHNGTTLLVPPILTRRLAWALASPFVIAMRRVLPLLRGSCVDVSSPAARRELNITIVTGTTFARNWVSLRDEHDRGVRSGNEFFEFSVLRRMHAYAVQHGYAFLDRSAQVIAFKQLRDQQRSNSNNSNNGTSTKTTHISWCAVCVVRRRVAVRQR